MKQNSSSRRANEQAREAIANILLFDVSDPRLHLVTITGCEVSFDRSVCNVYYTTRPDNYDTVANAFEAAKGHIRGLLARKLPWRVAPELRFWLDPSVDTAQRIARALAKDASRNTSNAHEEDSHTFEAQYTNDLADIARCLREHERIVLCGHVSPDGDCLGSQLALQAALESMGKTVVSILAENHPVDRRYAFLPKAHMLRPAEEVSESFDLFVALDVPIADRIGSDAQAVLSRASYSLRIDHHKSDLPFAHLNYEDVASPSTTMLVWKLAKLLGAESVFGVATCCYAGLLTDTGQFQFQNTNADAFVCAAEMVDTGVNPAEVARELFQNKTRAALALEQRVLERLSFSADGSCVCSWLSEADFSDVGATRSDAESLVNVLRSIEGVRIACLLREQDGAVRGNIRAKDATDISGIARSFGGGGHAAAAGFVIDDTLPQMRERVMEAMEATLRASASKPSVVSQEASQAPTDSASTFVAE